MPFILLFAEVMLVYFFIQAFGFLNLFLFYVLSTATGILIVKYVGTKSLRELQSGQVTSANRSLISGGLLFLSGLMLIVPSMWAKSFGILLFIPPMRWIFSTVFAGFLLKRVFSAKSFIHQFDRGGFKFYYQQGNQNPFENQNHEINEDVSQDIIDAEFRKIEDDPKLLK